jgi:predicted PurR-regulated permease PerM
VYLLIPPIIAETQKAIALFNQLLANSSYSFDIPSSIMAKLQPLLANLSAQALRLENIQTVLQTILPYLLQVASGAGNIFVWVMLAGMVILYLVFILKDYESLSEGWIQLIPKHYRPFTLQVTEDLKAGMNSYFRSQALIALLVGILFMIGFSVIKLPMAILFGFMVGLMNMVPYLQTVALIPALLLAAVKAAEYHQSFLWVAVSVLAVFALVQVIEEVFLTPRIMGKTTGLHPAVILLSLSIWGALLGVVGMILALPVTTILISYYNRFIIKGGMLEQLLLGDEVIETPSGRSPSAESDEVTDTIDS